MGMTSARTIGRFGSVGYSSYTVQWVTVGTLFGGVRCVHCSVGYSGYTVRWGTVGTLFGGVQWVHCSVGYGGYTVRWGKGTLHNAWVEEAGHDVTES